MGEGFIRPPIPSKVTIIYEGYFNKTKEIFDSTEGKPVEICLDDPQYVEGFREGIAHMRKGEKAKLTIKHKMGFVENNDKLKIPAGFENKRKELCRRRLIFKVKLLDFKLREDLSNKAGKIIKEVINRGVVKRKLKDLDELIINMEVKQGSNIFISKQNWKTFVDSGEIPLTVRKVLISMHPQEKSIAYIKPGGIFKEDEGYFKTIPYNDKEDLIAEIEILSFLKVDAMLNDDSTLTKILKKGNKNSHPYIESTVKFSVLVLVNEKCIYSSLWVKNIVSATVYNMIQIPNGEDPEYPPNSQIKNKLDSYTLPSLLIKAIKSMDTFEVKEIDTTRVEKLTNGLNSDFIKPDSIKLGDKIRIFIHLDETDRPESMHKLLLAEKRQRIEFSKNVANQFFKIGNIKKAAKLYQKINGYYNFGDITLGNEKEDKESKEFKENMAELDKMKLQCFLNLIVCKNKQKDYSSLVGVANQILEQYPNNAKALFFKAKAEYELQNYKEASETITKVKSLDPNN